MEIVTCTAPINIAVIKYWGKRDEKLILPLNDSISFTLSQDQMCARTTVALSEQYEGNHFWLNGREESLENPRIQNCLRAIRERVDPNKGNNKDVLQWGLRICSSNNFPTAAGLASSAAGYACLVYGLSKAYGVEGDLSLIARQGSGSACRSMDGGLVQWYMGELPDGSDSFARSIAPADHWPDLHVLICVVNAGRKKTGSTEGMRRSISTSRLMQYRVKESVVTRIKDITQAIENKNWSAFCDLTIADSNEMHAVCLDTFPPCVYLIDTSHAVAALVHRYNDQMAAQGKQELKVCYTFDAGPNACLFIPGAAFSEVMQLILTNFPPAKHQSSEDYVKGLPITTCKLSEASQSLVEDAVPGCLQFLIHTKVGDGPRLLQDPSCHLLDAESGLPKDYSG